MKETFRKNIETYSDLAKEELRSNELTNELRQVIDWHIRNAADKRYTNERTQAHIYRLQRAKQEVIANLKDQIKKIDDPSYKPEQLQGQYIVSMVDDVLYVTNDAGERLNITVGEIMTDGEWGLDYYLDPNTVPRNLRKRYLIETSKMALRFYLNKQIALDEFHSRHTDYFKTRAYESILKSLEGKKDTGGIIAEKMVKNFFKKLAYDGNLDVEIVDADAHQDVENKIDFIVKRSKKTRGVNVETADDQQIGYESVGIQFTTNLERAQQKTEHVRRIKPVIMESEGLSDVVVVVLSLSTVINDFNNWKSEKRPGGPDKLIKIANKKKIFEGVLKDIFTPEEIKDKWVKIELRASPQG